MINPIHDSFSMSDENAGIAFIPSNKNTIYVLIGDTMNEDDPIYERMTNTLNGFVHSWIAYKEVLGTDFKYRKRFTFQSLDEMLFFRLRFPER